MEFTKVTCATPAEFHAEAEKWAKKGAAPIIRGRKLIAYGEAVAELVTSRGGRRENAGAKPRDGVVRVAINCRVSAETKAWLDQNSTDGIGAMIDKLVRESQ